jgi:hypothetical protein
LNVVVSRPVDDHPTTVSRRPLSYLVAISLLLFARDLWLSVRGGGATPRWLLSVETAAFGFTALGGIAGSMARPGNQLDRWPVNRVIGAAGTVAPLAHAARLVIYLRNRKLA